MSRWRGCRRLSRLRTLHGLCALRSLCRLFRLLVGVMVTHDATDRGARHRMMSCHMAGDATDGGTLQTAFGIDCVRQYRGSGGSNDQ